MTEVASGDAAVATRTCPRMEPGRYSVAWDGTNQAGGRVSSGVYFDKMEADSKTGRFQTIMYAGARQ